MRAVTVQPCCRALLPKVPVQCRLLRPHTRMLAANKPDELQQPQQDPPAQPQQQAAAADAAAQPDPLQQPAGPTVSEAAALSAADQLEPYQEQQEQQLSPPGSPAATVLYLAMGGGLAAAGILAAVNAVPIAASCLKLGSLPLQQAAVLVGCGGAALLRAGSLALFVAGGAAAGELHTWRYQRINLGLAAAAAATLLLQPLSWAAAQPWLMLVLAAASAACAAACAGAFLQQWRTSGVHFASAIGYLDWDDGLKAAWVYLMRDVSTLAGSIMMLLTVLGVAAGLSALLGAGPAAAVPWAAASASVGQEAAVQYMRKLLGVGLLLSGLQCWALSEFAGSARNITPETAVKLVVVSSIEQQELQEGRLHAPLHASPSRFNLLHLGFFAAAVVQGLWLAQAGAVAGSGVSSVVNVNGADALWPVMYWTVLGSAAYLVSVLGSIDYTVLADWVLGFASYLSGWVSWFAVLLYVDWTWLTEARRR